MECPKCKIGVLVLYKEIEVSQQFKITRTGKIHKHPFSLQDFDTEKDYLECKNMECNQYFNYELDNNGEIVKGSLVKH